MGAQVMAGRAWTSFSEYARHRGVSPAAVHKAKAKIAAAISPNERGRMGIIDVALADRLWAATKLGEDHAAPSRQTVKSKARCFSAPPSEDPVVQISPLLEARIKREQAVTALKELDLKERTSELISAKDVEDRWATIAALMRTKVLSIPSKAKHAIPHLTMVDISEIERLVREALQEVADADLSA